MTVDPTGMGFVVADHETPRNSDNPLDECSRFGCAERAELHLFMIGGGVIDAVDGCREHVGDVLDAYYNYADGNPDVDTVVNIVSRRGVSA